jgi:hypothetical protein
VVRAGKADLSYFLLSRVGRGLKYIDPTTIISINHPRRFPVDLLPIFVAGFGQGKSVDQMHIILPWATGLKEFEFGSEGRLGDGEFGIEPDSYTGYFKIFGKHYFWASTPFVFFCILLSGYNARSIAQENTHTGNK